MRENIRERQGRERRGQRGGEGEQERVNQRLPGSHRQRETEVKTEGHGRWGQRGEGFRQNPPPVHTDMHIETKVLGQHACMLSAVHLSVCPCALADPRCLQERVGLQGPDPGESGSRSCCS